MRFFFDLLILVFKFIQPLITFNVNQCKPKITSCNFWFALFIRVTKVDLHKLHKLHRTLIVFAEKEKSAFFSIFCYFKS